MSYKNDKRTYKEIVEQVRMCLEAHQELGEDDAETTLQRILDVYEKSDIWVEGGHQLL